MAKSHQKELALSVLGRAKLLPEHERILQQKHKEIAPEQKTEIKQEVPEQGIKHKKGPELGF